VTLDDSSGDALSASGAASGVVTGKYTVDGGTTHAEISGTGLKLTINFERASQRFSARLDSCPASPDHCDAGKPVCSLGEMNDRHGLSLTSVEHHIVQLGALVG